MRTIVETHHRVRDAQDAVRELEGRGVDARLISIVARDQPREAEISDQIAPLVNECERLTIPDVGPGVVAGPVANVVKHSVEGSKTSELVGALEAGGLASESAKYCREAVRAGQILVAAHYNDEGNPKTTPINHHSQ